MLWNFFWSLESIKTTISDFSLKRYVFNLDADESVRNIDPCLLSEEYLNKKKNVLVKVRSMYWWKKDALTRKKRKKKKSCFYNCDIIPSCALFRLVRGCTGSKKKTADQQKFHRHGLNGFNSKQIMAFLAASTLQLCVSWMMPVLKNQNPIYAEVLLKYSVNKLLIPTVW